MFSIEQHRSISLTVLLIIFLEFAFVDKSTSNQGACEGSNKRNIDYFEGGTEELDWNAAWHLCNNQSSSLPVICNQYEQHDLTNYLKTHVRSSAIWISGKRITFDKWTWINGQTFENSGNLSKRQVWHADYTHVALKDDRNYDAEVPQTKVYYLCQYSGSLCNHSSDIHVTNGRCLRPSDEDRKWYNARNQCLLSGGDLATLDDDDLNIIRNSSKLNRAHGYWIGLRKNSWSWNWKTTADSNDEIKYSSWSNHFDSLRSECISIDASNGEWKSVGCTEKKKVVCQRSSNMMRSTTSSTTSRQMPNTTSSMTQSQVIHQDPSAECVCGTVSYSTLISVLIVGICLIVISNVIVAALVRKRMKSHSPSNTETRLNVVYQDLQTTQQQMNPKDDSNYTGLQLQPEYEEVGRGGRPH